MVEVEPAIDGFKTPRRLLTAAGRRDFETVS